MALEIKLNQKLTQTLAMTPQLRQAIELLQLGRQEYMDVISEELLKNPVLEEVAEGDDGAEAEAESARASANLASDDTAPVTPERFFDTPVAENRGDGEERRELETTASWQEEDESFFDHVYAGYEYSSPQSGRSVDKDRPSLEATVSYPEGLSSHLLWQLRTLDFADEDKRVAENIIGNLDRNGFLCISLAELAEICGRSEGEVETVLRVIQSLDPPGIGARDLQECLLIQLEQKGMADSLASRIVREHLGSLELRRLDLIAKKEGVSIEEVAVAVREIQKLEPRPGRPFGEEAPIYVTPDVYVRKVGEEYIISLNDSGIPRLRLSARYREMLENTTAKNDPSREYLVDQLRAAAGLIKSIHRRQQTIFKVTESIMKFQQEFLEQGVPALRPLVLRDVANDVSMHESTISRVTTNKYVHTPQGVYEL